LYGIIGPQILFKALLLSSFKTVSLEEFVNPSHISGTTLNAIQVRFTFSVVRHSGSLHFLSRHHH
jgi:hypothetical protein